MSGQHLIEKKSYRGYTIKVYPDPYAPHPRKEYEQLGTIVDNCRTYDIGEEDMDREYFHFYNNMWELFVHHINGKYEILEPKDDHGVLDSKELEEVGFWMENNVFHQPIKMLIHGIVVLKVGTGSFRSDPGGFDSGTAGYIYVTREDYLKFYGQEQDSLELQEKVLARLRYEVEEMNKYCSSEVYEALIEDSKERTVTSFRAYYDIDNLFKHAKREIDYHIHELEKIHLSRLKTWIKNKVPLEHRYSLQTALHS